MFNPLAPAEVVTAMGKAAHAAARSEEEATAFSRVQLLSTYSASRHLAVELESFDAELRRFARTVAAAVRGRLAGLPDADGLEALADRLDERSDPQAVGALVGDLLAGLREADAPAAVALRTEVQRRLRELADREVDLLAAVIEPPPRA